MVAITKDHSWKPQSRFNCQEFGVREDTDKPTVEQKHINLLQELIDIGIDGFRFDAAKHIIPSYLNRLIESLTIKNKQILCYAEILDGDVNVCHEYTNQSTKILRIF